MNFIIKNLKSFYNYHKIISIVIIACQMLSIFSLLAIYSKTYSFSKLNEYYSDELKTYTVSLNQNDKSNDYTRAFEKALRELGSIEEIVCTFKKPHNTYAYYLYPEKQSNFLYYGSYFNKKDFCTNSKCIVVGTYNRTNDEITNAENLVREINTEYPVLDEQYTVIGCAQNQWDEISYYSLNDTQKKKIESILFIFSTVPSSNEKKEIYQFLADTFPHSEITEPLKTNSDNNHMWETVASLSICILSAITLSFLINYTFEMRRKTISIYSIIGFNKHIITILLLVEQFLISTSIYVISGLIFRLFISKIMLNLDIINFEIGIVQYLYLYSLFIICVLLVMGIRILPFVNKNSKDIYMR